MTVTIDQWIKSGAIMAIAPGRLLVGWGSLRRLSSAAEAKQESIFYFPDFFLRNETPWFEYEHTQEIGANQLLQELLKRESSSPCSHHWENEYHSLFYQTFDALKEEMALNKIDKAVPFVFESSQKKMSTEQLQSSLIKLLKVIQDFPVFVYGFWGLDEGMLGVTPELLFRTQNNQVLETMACAGTSGKKNVTQALAKNPKELHEHQLVVKGISESLAPFGTVSIGERQVLPLPTVSHLVTPITVQLKQPLDFNKVVRSLHPTPALGAFPRDYGKRWLESYELQIERRRFGAPAGYRQKNGNVTCYVAIRNMQWDQETMLIGAGCGVVAASCCDQEWAEVNLKLKAIKEMLAL